MMDEGNGPAVFVDRDGTMCFARLNQDGNRDPEFIPTVLDGLKRLNHTGMPIFIITTQSDNGRSQFTEDEQGEIHDRILEILSQNGVKIRDILYCPHIPSSENGGDNYKPTSQMLLEGSEKHRIDLKRSVIIGDRIADIEVAREIGAKSILVPEPGAPAQVLDADKASIKPDFVAKNFMEAVFWLVRKIH